MLKANLGRLGRAFSSLRGGGGGAAAVGAVASPGAVDVLDLLGRPAVNLDTPELQRFLAGKRVLVTGAGGSIGSEICRQSMKFCPQRLILLDQAENALFEIDRELRHRWVGADISPRVADVTDARRVAAVFEAEEPQVVFHAAAHKHVPMMELNPGEAVKNNVFGTQVVADAALAAGVAAFVMVSTDKAVNPTSVMGAAKRCAELYIQSLNGRGELPVASCQLPGRNDEPRFPARGTEPGGSAAGHAANERYSTDGRPTDARPPSSHRTRFVAVRFGNVLGSSGSVVPIFRKQIEAGGPVTVTHPDMRRFFMTIPEASQLVMQAGAIGRGGEIFVLDMGEPIRILDLAAEMIRRGGLTPGEDIAIQFTGIRPGEKLYEELAGEGEHTRPTGHPKIHVWQLPPATPAEVNRMLDVLGGAVHGTREQVVAALRQVVPEYTPDGAGKSTAAEKAAVAEQLRLHVDPTTKAA